MAMLTIGLDILRLLAEAGEPLTATAIAERVGLHPSNVSRTLRVLIQAGYVRKPTYHSFAVDLGVLALAGHAVHGLPLLRRSRAAVLALAAHTGAQAVLATCFRDEILYLHLAAPGSGGATTVAGGFPLHRSAVALRLLLDLPEAEAVALLAASRRRYGWDRPTPAVPADPAGCLAAARAALLDGVLVLAGWNRPDYLQVAAPLVLPGTPPLALALSGTGGDPERWRAALALALPALRSALEQP